MKEIIEQVLKEEEKARLMLEGAQAQAERMVSGAKQEADRLHADSAAQAHTTAGARIAEADRDLLSEKAKVLQGAKDSTRALRVAREKDIAGISQEIFQRLISIED